jgi:hypothetical protein
MIRENVKLTFDPSCSKEKMQKIFFDNLTRTIWLAGKDGRITEDYFDDWVLFCAEEISRTIENQGKLTSERLFLILEGKIIGSEEQEFAEALLPFVLGEKNISYEIIEGDD